MLAARNRTMICTIGSLVASLTGNAVCSAGTKVTLGQRIARGQLVSMDQVDHGAWDALLMRPLVMRCPFLT